MPGRVILGLALGVVGFCLGVAGAVLPSSPLAIVGVCAVAGGFGIAGVTFVRMLQRSDGTEHVGDRIDALTSNVDHTTHLPRPGGEQSVIDSVTELPDGRYFEIAVDGRVAAARRHLWPVSIVLVQIGFDSIGDTSTDAVDRSIAGFAGLMRQTLREADIACRLDANTFGLILEDTSEEGGVWTAERLQIALSRETTLIRRLVAGVAAYPTHGLFAKDVLVRAQSALHRAASTPAGHGLGQVEVAHVDLG